jgi:mannose-6-phosphate isomerase-like protein (cupin superfamily)
VWLGPQALQKDPRRRVSGKEKGRQMPSEQNHRNVRHHIAEGTPNPALDVFGPTVEFLTSPADAHDDFCVMRGVIPPGVAIPLHSHDDTEEFFIVAVAGPRPGSQLPGPR